MGLQKLSTGQQDFAILRNDNLIYVDKTRYIYELLESKGRNFFLSRPRRFGKSLLVNTLKELFLGNKQYFKGLYIEDKIEWETYPVLHFDFSNLPFRTLGLYEAIRKRLYEIADEYQIVCNEKEIDAMFRELIHKLHEKTGKQVVILVDEYDKPITDYLEQKYIETALQNRDIMRSFYGILKGNSGHIRFFFLTGISRFSKVSLFSDLNHLTDLSFERKYHNICGYTQEEIEWYFTPHVEQISQESGVSMEKLWEQIRVWYNGYSWDGVQRVYNPFSVLRFLESGQFGNYWFESGTPKFLVELLKKDNLRYDITRIAVDKATFNFYDIEQLNIETLLFQTGYLTINQVDSFGRYILNYPNKEVEQSMLQYLLVGYSENSLSNAIAINLIEAIAERDMEKLVDTLNQLFASIPAEIFIAKKEAYYHSIVYLAFRLCGFHTQAEVRSSRGRLDAMLKYKNNLFLFEFKLDGSAEDAVRQIQEKEYYKPYYSNELDIYFVGINFSSEKKEVAEYKVVKL